MIQPQMYGFGCIIDGVVDLGRGALHKLIFEFIFNQHLYS